MGGGRRNCRKPRRGEDAAAPEESTEKVRASILAEALALSGAGDSPQARGFLEKSGQYLDMQMACFKEEEHLRLAQLHSQLREGGLRRIGQRLRNSLLVFSAVAATVVGFALLGMLSNAVTSNSVVVEPFDTPPTLAVRGINGKVVATGLLDGLQKLQDATRATTQALRTRGAWASDIKIEVPETGASIGEIDRLLHQRFGHDVHIQGDLVQTETGSLVLTVRGDGVPAQTFEGATADLAKLTDQAAGYIYGRSQPYRYATYLVGSGRNAEALAFIPSAFAGATTDQQRAEVANTWGNAYSALNQAPAAAAKYRLALSLNPRLWKSRANLVASVSFLNEEAGWREAQAFMQAADAAPSGDRPESRLLTNSAQTFQDLPLLLSAYRQDAAHNGGTGAALVIDSPMIADVYSRLHSPAMADRYLASSPPDDPLTKAMGMLIAARHSLDNGDIAGAAPPMEAFWKAWKAEPSLRFTLNDGQCVVGQALGLNGRMAEAEAAFQQGGSWALCAALHGDVLEHAGDLAGAQRVWAESLRIAPDLSVVWLHRGLSELNRGDLRGAAADLAIASNKSPHWADPLKAWGDVLAHQDRWTQAKAKYAEALKYAPDWDALRAARNTAAAHGG
jgi:tetratricopeptide (TPR) repeat protein